MTTPKLIYIASDHAGFTLKETLKKQFPDWPWEDLGTHDESSVDYPDYAEQVAAKVAADENALGVLMCGSGQGMAIKANRNPKIRAALCWDAEVAELARAHNNANVLCLPSRLVDHSILIETVKVFFKTDFERGRHARRVEKLRC